MTRKPTYWAVIGVLALTLPLSESFAADAKPQFSPNVAANIGKGAPKKLLWGDTHQHSGWSGDAGAFGAKLSPEDAVRFARGEEIVSSTGQAARLDRPLDFIVIADHSDGMGLIQEMRAGNPIVMNDPIGKRWTEMMKAGGKEGLQAATEMIDAQSNNKLPDFVKNKEMGMAVWQKNTAIQEKYNEPGRFTTLIGYEWTSNYGGGDNLHRNVIFRDGKDKADAMVPYTTFDSENVEDLWKWMHTWEEKTGGKVLAIPHNGNLSNGRMFALTDLFGNPMTRAYAEARTRWEPLYEVTQIKGDSETHATLSPNDEFANFERWDKVNLNGVPKKDGQLQYEYARQALKNGMLMESRLGANPFKYGMIGSTDSHTGLSTPAENNYFSKHAGVEPKADRWSLSKHSTTGWQYQASGYAAVWAQDNTRGAIWDALKTKEVYGTTGSRIAVRVFGGFDFSASDVQRADFADVGYAKGVPMGGELKAAAKGQAPVLMIQAAKDPVGGNLDRVQVIKGWLDAKGAVQEKIYDVAWSGQRKAGKDGKLPSVGNTVNVKEATWSNSIGAPALEAVWRDPSFDPALKAFYYVRVIEIPTPRWTAYDAKRYGVTMGPEVPMIVTERAYTSPIWYNP
ncbi:MAG: DUF3604 domain-containing protein [Rhodocyclaceae bacterium]|nr:DUF3604 domain-containing protein [Rhodocyclaceae bacterium]